MSGNRNFYSLEEIRKDIFQCQLSRAHIYNAVKRGDIAVVKVGRRLLVPSYWVEALMKPEK